MGWLQKHWWYIEINGVIKRDKVGRRVRGEGGEGRKEGEREEEKEREKRKEEKECEMNTYTHTHTHTHTHHTFPLAASKANQNTTEGTVSNTE